MLLFIICVLILLRKTSPPTVPFFILGRSTWSFSFVYCQQTGSVVTAHLDVLVAARQPLALECRRHFDWQPEPATVANDGLGQRIDAIDERRHRPAVEDFTPASGLILEEAEMLVVFIAEVVEAPIEQSLAFLRAAVGLQGDPGPTAKLARTNIAGSIIWVPVLLKKAIFPEAAGAGSIIWVHIRLGSIIRVHVLLGSKVWVHAWLGSKVWYHVLPNPVAVRIPVLLR